MFGEMQNPLEIFGVVRGIRIGVAFCKWILEHKGLNELVSYLNRINLSEIDHMVEMDDKISIGELSEQFLEYVNNEARNKEAKDKIEEKYGKKVKEMAKEAAKEYENMINNSDKPIVDMSVDDFLKEMFKE